MPGSCHPPPSPPITATPSSHTGPPGPSARDPPSSTPLQRAAPRAPPAKVPSPEPCKGLNSPFSAAYHAENKEKLITGEKSTAFTEERGAEQDKRVCIRVISHLCTSVSPGSAHPRTTWPGRSLLARCLHPRRFPPIFGASAQLQSHPLEPVVENCCKKKRPQLMISRAKALQQDLKLDVK